SGSLAATGNGGDPEASITVASTGAVVAGGTINAGAGGVAIDAGGHVILGGALVAGSLDVPSSGSAQEGTLRRQAVSGPTTVEAVGDIALNRPTNFFAGTVTLEGGTASILNNGTLFLGAVNVDSLTADAATIVLQDDVTSTGSQIYAAAVELGNDVDLKAGADVVFVSTLDGAQQLSIVADGHVGISGAVDVGELSIDAGTFSAGAGMRTSRDLSLSVLFSGIGQLGAFEVGGESNFDAGARLIDLTHANNDFGG